MAKQTRNPNRYAHLQGKVRWGRCEICGIEYPESTIRTQEGRAVCPDCFEPNGMTIGRDRARRDGTSLAAQIAASHKNPKYTSSDGITRAGMGVTVPFVREVTPVVLIHETPVEVTATGRFLSAASVRSIVVSDPTYVVSDIVYPSTDQIDFTVTAPMYGPPGEWDLTFTFEPFGNANVFRKCLTIRTGVYPVWEF